MTRTTITLAQGEDTGDVIAGILQGVIGLRCAIRLRNECDGRGTVYIEVNEIDGESILGNGFDPATDMPDEPDAIRGDGFDFTQIERIEVL